MDAHGKFEFRTIPEIVVTNVNTIIAQIKSQYNTDTLFLDKNKTFSMNDRLLTSNGESHLPDMNLVYKISIKDLTPLLLMQI